MSTPRPAGSTTSPHHCRSQGFIDFIVFPLYDAFRLFMEDDVTPHLDNIARNKAHWKDVSEAAQAAAAAAAAREDGGTSLPQNMRISVLDDGGGSAGAIGPGSRSRRTSDA